MTEEAALLAEPSAVVLDSAEAVARLAAELVAAAVRDAVADRGRADIATTGGSTAPVLYRRLCSEPLASTIPWERLHLWWGDDRFVSRTDPDSNVRPADEILAGRIAPANLHPFPVEVALAAGRGTTWCADRYSEQLAVELPLDPRGMPVFDLVLLGVGADGHCLSVFPSDATPAPERPGIGATPPLVGGRPVPTIAIAVPAPTHIGPHLPRVTLTLPVLDAARALVVMATGGAKAGVLAEVFGPIRDDSRWPAQRARRAGAVWILDEAAAAHLAH